MPIPKPSALVKPTLTTKFHVDFAWWDRSPDDLRTYLLSHLPPDQRDRIGQMPEAQQVDYIDPNTGEVFQLDPLRLAIQEVAESPDFINEQISLVDGVFRVFLKTNNTPLSPNELADYTGRSPATILKTLSGRQIYKGIRPIAKEQA